MHGLARLRFAASTAQCESGAAPGASTSTIPPTSR